MLIKELQKEINEWLGRKSNFPLPYDEVIIIRATLKALSSLLVNDEAAAELDNLEHELAKQRAN